MSQFNSEKRNQFITAWKEAVNSPAAKPTYKPCDATVYVGSTAKEKAEREALGYQVHKYHYTVPGGATCKQAGWIYSAHHLLHNIIMNKEWHNGFTKTTNRNKLGPGRHEWQGFLEAVRYLSSTIHHARNCIEADTDEAYAAWVERRKDARWGFHKEKTTREDYNREIISYHRRWVDNFLKPFNGVVTIEDLAAISTDRLNSVLKMMEGF